MSDRLVKVVYKDHFNHVQNVIAALKKLSAGIPGESPLDPALRQVADSVKGLVDSLDEGREELVGR